MTIITVLSWMLCGLIVGLIARFLVPGRQNMNLLLTMALGIVGALVGGFLYSLVLGVPADPFSFEATAWQSWVVAIIGAVFVLLAFVVLYPKRSSQ